jgi:3-deoxy-D-manno-octulosonic-acid transferase
MILRSFLYNLLLVTVLVLGLPWIVYQALFVPKRRHGLWQRLGAAPNPGGPVIWCHAVSVGEVRAITPMLSLLNDDERMKGRIVLSTVTPTGQETARRECGFVQSIFFFPLDFIFAVNPALERVRPSLFITAETEIWPNFFRACFRRDIPVIIVNGRLSDSSFPRYLKFKWFFKTYIAGVSLFLMQSEEDARRVLELGARPESVVVTGNTKYDRKPVETTVPAGVTRWAEEKFLLVAGSTHEGEEEAVLEALESIVDAGFSVRAAIVPRHPERFDTVASLLDKKKMSWERYSTLGQQRQPDSEIILVDAMGVLEPFYAVADAAFVGGSLVPTGGHNLLEPAMHSVPVLTGPNLHNFREIADQLITEGGCQVVHSVDELARALNSLMVKPDLRVEMGKRAGAATVGTTGASRRNADKIFELPGVRDSQ